MSVLAKHEKESQRGSGLRLVAENEAFRVDYDDVRGMYRVTYFEDCHYQDEIWFDEINH